MFLAWHRGDAMSDVGRQRCFTMHRNKFLEIVRNPPDVSEARTLAQRFAIIECDDSRYDMSRDYFRFLFEEGVEPTNNHEVFRYGPGGRDHPAESAGRRFG